MTITDETYLLIIKGNKDEAMSAAAVRNIPFVFDDELPRWNVTLGKSNAPVNELAKWLMEDTLKKAPYEPGSLLFYQLTLRVTGSIQEKLI